MRTRQFLRALKRRTGNSARRLARVWTDRPRLGQIWHPRAIPILSGEAVVPPTFTPTQEHFCVWNAERLGIDLGESKRRYIQSMSMLPDGHAGPAFRSYCELSYGLFQVYHNDSETEVYDAYEMHSRMHFLRMLAYPESVWQPDHPLIRGLSSKRDVTIIDYGCGLAQLSRGLAQHLRGYGTDVRIVLVDIPTLRKDFLIWLGTKTGTPTQFLDCSTTRPVPDLPNSDVVIATEVFEHLHDPLPVFEAIHRSLEPSGFLLTNLVDHHEEFMHVSPNQQILRDRVGQLGYEELEPSVLLRKPSSP